MGLALLVPVFVPCGSLGGRPAGPAGARARSRVGGPLDRAGGGGAGVGGVGDRTPTRRCCSCPPLHVWLLLAAPQLRPRRALGWFGLLGAGGAAAGGRVPVLRPPARPRPWATPCGRPCCCSPAASSARWRRSCGASASAAGWPRCCWPSSATAPTELQIAEEPVEVTIRGPLSYAGPGSLGGTESALRR